MNGDVCESCGSHQVRPATVAGFAVEECDLCGHVQGDDDQVAKLAVHREAEERGVDPEIYELVQALEQVPTFRVDQASAGRPTTSEYPFVFLRLATGALPHLERLLTSIEMVTGTAQADTLLGGGNDFFERFRGLEGNDLIDGRTGYDIADYSRDARHGGTSGVTASLVAGSATDGFGDTDTLMNIEGLRGTKFVDTLTGGNAVNDDFETSLTVLATAISQPAQGAITVDCGFKGFASETVAPECIDVAGTKFVFAGDEHGVLLLGEGSQQPLLGHKLSFVTPHCDPTVNLYDYYWVHRDGVVGELWPIAARGCSW